MNYLVDEFPREYDVETDVELHGGEDVIDLYAGTRIQDGLLVRTQVAGKRRVWRCGFGDSELTTILATPDPTALCIVARGIGYLIRPEFPEQSTVLPLWFIRHVRAYPVDRCVLLADDSNIAALGPVGVSWTSPRVSSDGIGLGASEDGVAQVTVWSAPRGREETVRIELATGKIL